MLAFVIPLRHPLSSKNWSIVCARLVETLRSVSAACAGGFATAYLVANEEASLPELPACVTVLRIDDPPPPVSVFRGETPDADRRRAVWLDKGRKVATGVITAQRNGALYVMPVDADDLIDRTLPDFVARHAGASGWYVRTGWLLPDRAKIGLLLSDFHNWCGTYVIVRTDLLPLKESVSELDPELIRMLFGHHRELLPWLKARNHKLEPLPFPAAVYRIGHGEGNFQRGSLRSEVFTWRRLRSNPTGFIKQLGMIRPFLANEKRLFLGEI